jgi:hypothetical protein
MKTERAVIGLALAGLIIGGIFRGMGGSCEAAIVYPKAPAGGGQIVYEHLRAHPDELGGLQIKDLTIAEPHRWYGVGLADLASGHLVSAATSGAWRYILLHGANAVGVAQVSDADAKAGNALQFSGLFETCFSKETLEALRIAETLPQVKKQDYELRLLDNPGVLFSAVWLHGKSDDIIIPLPPTFGRWNDYEAYSERQIIKLLKPEAKKRLKAPGLGSAASHL